MRARLKNDTDYGVYFYMTDSSNNPLPGLTPTVMSSANGSAFGAASGYVSELGNGFYFYTLTAAEVASNGEVALIATASGAVQCVRTIDVTNINPFAAKFGITEIDTTISSRASQQSVDSIQSDISDLDSELNLIDSNLDDIGGSLDGVEQYLTTNIAGALQQANSLLSNADYGLAKLARSETPVNKLAIDTSGKIAANNMRGTDGAVTDLSGVSTFDAGSQSVTVGNTAACKADVSGLATGAAVGSLGELIATIGSIVEALRKLARRDEVLTAADTVECREEGTTNVLMTKKLKKTDGTAITDISSETVGQRVTE